MLYEEAVAYYHSLERFGIRPGLERISALCRSLGDPQEKFPCVHVAGTNGKGSTCTEIASVLAAAGYRVGLYTSPYVIEFRERIRLNGKMIPREELVAVTEIVRSAAEKLAQDDICITEFEAVTAAAFLYYARSQCDVVVLETGLGGRFDATNIIKSPLCSVITSVSLDHTRVLGNTLSEIAFEKCGIIKRGRPVVTSLHQSREAMETIKRCTAEQGSELIIAEPERLSPVREDITGSDVIYHNITLHIPFAGKHQIENASLTVCATEVLCRSGFSVSDAQLRDGLAAAMIPARIEIISQKPLVILDGCHNEGSTAALGNAMREYLPGRRILAVMGMMADKDHEKAVDNLLPYFSKVITVTPSNQRSLSSEAFCEFIRNKGTIAESVSDPVEGVRTALKELDRYDALIVCGSLYLASDVRSFLLAYQFDKKQEDVIPCQ